MALDLWLYVVTKRPMIKRSTHIRTRAIYCGTLLSRGFAISGEEQSRLNVIKKAIRSLVRSKDLLQLLHCGRRWAKKKKGQCELFARRQQFRPFQCLAKGCCKLSYSNKLTSTSAVGTREPRCFHIPDRAQRK